MPSSTTQFLESRFGFKSSSSTEDNADRLLKRIKKDPGVACAQLYQAVVRLSDSGALTRMITVAELKALAEVTACARSKCAELLQPSVDALSDALVGYTRFFDGAEDGRIKTSSLLRTDRCFTKHSGCTPLHNLHRHMTNVIEVLSEVTFDEIHRFHRHHPHFANLRAPLYWPACNSANSFTRNLVKALTEPIQRDNEVFGVKCKTATTSLVSMTQCYNKVYLGRLVNDDEYVAVKIAYARSKFSPLCPSESTVNFLMSPSVYLSRLHALYIGPSGMLISATQLGLCNLNVILNALEFVRWLFLEGQGQIDSERLRLLADVAKSRYDKFPERSSFPGYDGYSWTLIQDLAIFRNPISRFRYVNEVGRRLCNCTSTFFLNQHAHQDIKPANIVVYDKGNDVEIKTIDYDSVVSSTDTEEHLKKSRHWGTPGYLDPQYQPDDGTIRSRQNADVFALGITLREVAGERLSGIYAARVGSGASYPHNYPTFNSVRREFLIEDQPSHIYHAALLLSGKLEYSQTGGLIRSRIDSFTYLRNRKFFNKSTTLDEPIFRRATLSLIKLGLSLTESHQAEMYRMASRQYGVACGAAGLGSRILIAENTLARRNKLAHIRTAPLDRLQADMEWRITEMMRGGSSSDESVCTSKVGINSQAMAIGVS